MTPSSAQGRGEAPKKYPKRPWTWERVLVAARLKSAPVDPATGKPRKPNRVEDRIVVAGGLAAVVAVLNNVTDALKSLAKGPLAGTVPTVILVTGGALVVVSVLAAYVVARVGGRQSGEAIVAGLREEDLFAAGTFRLYREAHDTEHRTRDGKVDDRFRRIEQHLGLTPPDDWTTGGI